MDFDEFEDLSKKVKDLKGSIQTKPLPEVPAGFADSASALPLRHSFEAFAAFGKGSKGTGGAAVDTLNRSNWAKLIKDCGQGRGA